LGCVAILSVTEQSELMSTLINNKKERIKKQGIYQKS